ncbi:hypothetical protein ACROYT_G022706 [Oculina patagonica]
MYPQRITENHEHSNEEYNDPNCPTWLKKITRTKPYLTLLSESTLRRTLSTMDLTLLGVGTAIGIGIYVMTAKLSHDTAGLAVILSIVLASLSVLLSGICYAEFSSRVPKCGSAYVYCYTAVGEIWAFIVGWTMIAEYLIAMAVLAQTCNILALLLAITVVVIVAVGMRWAMIFNRAMFVFSIISLILLFVIVLFLVRPENWARNFAPYGVQGVLRAAAGVYYAFIGLDAITAVSGEAIRPQSSVPLSIIMTVTMVAVTYCGLATVFTLIAPYDQLSDLAPLAKMFQAIPGAQYVAAIGAISATLSALLSCSIAGPRVLFNMANDGLLFTCFGCVSESSRAIEIITVVGGFLSGCLAALFATEHLIELLSIGPLFAYTMVAVSVLLTRYQPGVEGVVYGKAAKLERTNQWLKSITTEPEMYPYTFGDIPYLQKRELNGKKTSIQKEPSKITGYNASFAVFLLVISLSCLAIILTTVLNDILTDDGWAFLSGGLNYWTFVRFGVWLVPGLLIYGFYGYRRSNEALKPKQSSEDDFIMC